MKKFCQEVFPDIEANINTPGWLEGRTILAPTNKEVDVLNEVIQHCDITRLCRPTTSSRWPIIFDCHPGCRGMQIRIVIVATSIPHHKALW